MVINYFCPGWGSEDIPWYVFCSKVKAAGYGGIEAGIPFDATEKVEIARALEKYGLLLLGQYFQSSEKHFDAHAVSFEKNLRDIASLNPVLIDAQTGKDYFSQEQNSWLFSIAGKVTEETGIQIAHETHRNKNGLPSRPSSDLIPIWFIIPQRTNR